MEFSTWIEFVYARHRLGIRTNSQLGKLTDLKGKLLVDHVGQLENVQDTLDWVSEKINIDRIEMPHVNSRAGPDQTCTKFSGIS